MTFNFDIIYQARMDYAQKDGVDQPATVFTSFAAQQKSSGGRSVDTSDTIEFRLNGASLGSSYIQSNRILWNLQNL